MTNVMEVILNLVDNLSGGMASAENAVDSLESSVETASDSIDNINTSNLDNIEQSADEAGLSVEQIGEAASMANTDLSSISSEPVKETGNSAKTASGEMQGLSESAGLVETAMGAIVSIGIVSYLESAAEAAGTFESRWSRIGIVMGESGASIEQLQAEYGGAIDQMKDSTGRGLGAAQESIISLGIAGVTNKDVLVDSFEAISGAAFIKNGGKDLDSISNAYTRMVQTGTLGTRQLASLGISTEGVFKATGMSLDELKSKFPEMSAEARAALLNTIIMANGGAEANAAYKNSWQYLTDQLGLAFDYIQRIVGSLILPTLNPAISTATDIIKGLGDALNNLPAPIKNIMGFVTVLAGAIGVAAGAFFSVNGVLGLFGTSLGALAGGLGSTVLSVIGLILALDPLTWVIMAIVAAVITAIYIWSTWNKEITDLYNSIVSGNWGNAANIIGNAFSYVGTSIQNALTTAWDAVVNFIINIPTIASNNATTFINMGEKIVQWIITGLTSLSTYLTTVLNSMFSEMGEKKGGGANKAGKDIGKSLLDGISDWINANSGKIAMLLVNIFMKVIPLLLIVMGQILLIIGIKLMEAANYGGQMFLNTLKNWFMQLPGMAANAFMTLLMTVTLYLNSLILQAANAGSSIVTSFVSYLSTLPGTASQIISGIIAWFQGMPARVSEALTSIKDAVVQQLWNAYNGAMSMVGAFVDIGYQIKDKVVSGIMGALGISSPSKETYTLGEAVAQGLLEGMKDWVVDNYTYFIEPIKDKLKDGLILLAQMFEGFNWVYYWDSQQSIATTLATMTANCYDAAVAFIYLANNMGITAELWRTYVGSTPHMIVNLPTYGMWIDPSGVMGEGLFSGQAPGSAAGGGGAGKDLGTLEVNHVFNLENVPEGNSDKKIADMVVKSIDNKKVLDKINYKLGSLKNSKSRSRGV